MRKKLMLFVLSGSIFMMPIQGRSAPTELHESVMWGINMIWDSVGTLTEAAFLALQYFRKDTKIKIGNEMEQIKENIGMFQDQGKCGISATGNSGCDLTTEEQGQKEAQEMEEEAQTVPNTIIELVNNKENLKFKNAQNAIADGAFSRDGADANKDCTCENGKKGDECTPLDCARDRVNEDLMVSSQDAAVKADSFFQKGQEKHYKELQDLVDKINTQTTLNDFISELGNVSVYASDRINTMMNLYAHDLIAQSYRNLSTTDLEEVSISEDVSGGTNDNQ